MNGTAGAIGKVIQQYLADKLGLPPHAIHLSERFRRLGVDSVTATSMLASLGVHLGRSLSPTLAWQFPTPFDLARHLAGDGGTAEAPLQAIRSAGDEPIAIVGIACRLPGASDPAAFWTLLREGADAVRQVPPDRWNVDAFYDADVSAPGKMTTRWGGFLDDVASFDPGFFGISPREAAQIDPQQRLMLELSWESLEDAGLAPHSLKDTRTGVFFGAMWMDYSRVPGATAEGIGPYTATGQDLSIIPARVSYTLGLLGPSIAVNTACSSSLVAVHLARQSLLRGESRLALAGGVNLILSPESTIAMTKFGGMAPDGRCKAFDARANGYVRGEGGGVVALKRLSDAIADGDRIYCTIRGSALNNDGFSNGLTAPSPMAQEAVIRDACADARVDPADVQYVEAHGTATMLGDPIEAGALGRVLGGQRPATRPLRIGSVKTNIGHLEAAAGVAGLVKVALSMHHKVLPPNLHFREPNPHIHFDELRIRVQDTLEPWTSELGRRIAGVSSFGFGGTNAHLVVEGVDAVEPVSARLAAPSAEALVAMATDLADHLHASGDALAAPAKTPTRSPSTANPALAGLHRLALTARSAEEGAAQLEGFVRAGRSSAVLGRSTPSRESASAPQLVVLSESAPRALNEWAARLRAHLDAHPEVTLGEIAGGLLSRGPLLAHRLALAVPTRQTLVEQLDAASRGATPAGSVRGDARETDGKLAWIFTGQGAQVPGMGSGLFEAWPAFRQALVAAFESLDAHLERPLRQVMWAEAGSSDAALLDQTAYTQPALFAIEWALASLWRSWGVEPDFITGHSIGEIAAASFAGVFTLADAARLVCARGRLMQALPADGAMVSIEARESDVAAAVGPHAATVSIAAINDPTSVVIAGVERQVLQIAESFAGRGIRTKRLVVSHAFHSPLMAPMLAEFQRVAESIRYQAPSIPMVSSVSGVRAGAEIATAAYWVRHVRETVRFAEGVKALQAAGVTSFVEMGPRATLLGLVATTLADARPMLLPSLRAGDPEAQAALESLGALVANGHAFDPKGLLPSYEHGLRTNVLPGLAVGTAPIARPKVVLVFGGSGSQWLGMGRSLLHVEEAAARAALLRCDEALRPFVNGSVVERLEGDDAGWLEHASGVEPAIFAVQVALAEALLARGLTIDAVLGHGMGEVAAAYVAGALSLDDAARVICARSAPPAELRQRIATIQARSCKVAFWSAIAGEPRQGSSLDAEYWARNLGEPPFLAPALMRLASEPRTVFVEVDPHPVLASVIARYVEDAGLESPFVACAMRGQPESSTLVEAAGQLFVAGCAVEAKAPSEPAPSAQLVVLSAKTPAALRASARRLRDQLDAHPEARVEDVAFSLLATRSPMECRLALAVASRGALREGLDAAASRDAPTDEPEMPGSTSPRVVFVFPGQGSQWLGMGRELLAEEPTFREALLACDRAVAAETGWSVVAELSAPAEASQLHRIDIVQPVLFAVEIALAALWRSWGIEPHAVVGHSMGEAAAACVAGALSIEDGAAVICRRSALLRRVSGKGAMALVELTADAASAELAGFEDLLGIAVSNSRRTTVLSGDPGALDQVLARLEGRGTFCRRIKVDVASHSPQMDPLLDELRAKLAGITPRAATVPMRSTVTGATLAGPELTAAYWADNLRAPVRFGQAIESLLADGFTLFVEMSPHPILVPAVEEVRQAAGVPGLAAGSLRREQPERLTLLDSLGALHVHGHPLDAKRLFPSGARRVPLPTYAWERVPCWLDVPDPSLAANTRTHPGGHPLLGVPTQLSTQAGTWVWEVVLDPKRLPWLPDHRIQGAALFPAAGYVEMALAIGAEVAPGASIEVADIEISQVLALPEKGGVVVQAVVSAHSPGAWRIQVSSRAAGEGEAAQWLVHARAAVRRVDPGATAAQADLASWRRRLGEPMDIAALYATFAVAGLDYGPAFRGILELRRGETEALARVDLPAAGGSAASYRMHPSVLDGCFQVMEGLLADGSASTWLPVGIDSLRVHERIRGPLWCLAQIKPGTRGDPDRRSADLAIFAESGARVADVVGLQVRRVAERAAPRQEDDWMLALDWEPRPLPPAVVAGGRWLLVGDGAGVGDALARSLEAAGHAVVQAVRPRAAPPEAGLRLVDETHAEGLRSLLLQAFGGIAPTAIVHLRSLERGDDPDPIEAAIARGCDSVLAVVKAVTSMSWRDPPRLWVVTRGAQAVGDADVNVVQAPVLGLARVIAMEHGELRCGRIDLDGATSSDDARVLHAELVADDAEDEVAWRGGTRSALRFARAMPGEGPSSRLEPAAGRPFALRIGQPGVIDRLELAPLERRSPGAGEVEIAVEAAGINFRDVLLTLGVIPDEVGHASSGLAVSPGVQPGVECAGRVVSIGEGVARLAVGDAVIALAPRGAMASHVTTSASLVVPRPAAFSTSQGASVPIVYLTAWYALEKLARLQRGERVLIHAATGGVGLAAVQWAKHVGAEIYATAGSAEKRALLEQMGVPFVSDSRSDRFVDDIRTWTNGAGVDVVLNSLSGDLIAKSFDLLRPFGRFVELGKRDYYANGALGLRPFLKGLSFSLVDLHGMLVDRPGWVGDLLRELLAEFDAGSFSPPEVETFPISRVQDAFRKMAQGRHVGKLAVTLADDDARIHFPAESGVRVRGDGSYLVTGGLGGLGLSVAEWLARRGAGHIVLVGRSGATTDAQRKAVAAIEAQGASVVIAAADVAQRAALDAVLTALPQDRPLRGVFHAAGLLDDGLLEDQTPARLRKAMAPKVHGAWNLHTLTCHATLDLFVLYASVNGIIGSPAQGNYAAANVFLDALAHHRRAQGLPAIAIDWGVFAEVGLAASEETRGKRLEGRGMRGLTPTEGLVALERVIGWNPRQVAVARLDVHQWVEFYPNAAGSRTLSRLLQEKGRGQRRANDGGLIESLAAADPESRLRIVEGALREQVGKVLRIRPESIGREVPLAKLGMDSLMGLELRNRIEVMLGVRLPAGALWTYPTLIALTTRLTANGETDTAAAVESPAAAPGGDVMANKVATMGSTDLMSLLDTLLESASPGPK